VSASGPAPRSPASGGAPVPDDPVTVAALAAVRAAFPDAVLEAVTGGRHPFLVVAPGRLREVARLLRDHPDLRLDGCHLVTGVDQPAEGRIDVVYHLVSWSRPPDPAYRTRPGKNDAWVALKVRVPRDRPEVPSVADVWTGADWHERETYDLVGVVFTGRRDLRRILLPEDWPGHPLRKDWEYPADYHGVPIVPPEAQE
jgi:NADH-quinone oxidoreductase subunit C